MISRIKLAFFLTLISCVSASAVTTRYDGPNVYVPDYRLEKIYQVSDSDIYAVRGSLKRMDNFVELWVRIIPRNNQQKTLDLWNREKIAIDAKTGFVHLNLHFYCASNKAAIPATYLFDQYDQLVDSIVMMMDEPFSIDDKPILKHIKKMACSGKLDRLSDYRE